MLRSLDIKDIVLIDRLQMNFDGGLCVLSGETGAGKSILLASLGLATGGRAERELVRHGTEQGAVTAVFSVTAGHEILKVLDEQGLDYEKSELEAEIILRRIVTKDGRSRAFLNDQSVSAGLLREIGGMLVEIHGQHDERGLLNAAGHRDLLDQYGPFSGTLEKVKKSYKNWKEIKKSLKAEEEKLAAAQADEEYIRHNLSELEELAPTAGEEEELSKERTRMMQGEKMSDGLSSALNALRNRGGVDPSLQSNMRDLERLSAAASGILEPSLEMLERASIELGSAISALEEVQRELEFDPYELEGTEERLFALRAAARKHQVTADQLPELKDDFAAKLEKLEHSDKQVRMLTVELEDARKKFEENVTHLSEKRKKAGDKLSKLVNKELPPLKLAKAKFRVHFEVLDRSEWNMDGGERIEFEITTNPGTPFGSLIKIASGGELSRFTLALKVVLAGKSTVSTLIFDEIDQGVGGAVADAIGERLRILSKDAQIMVITHSPQVAASGIHHWFIVKSEEKEGSKMRMATRVRQLSEIERREEIARMLSGAIITDEARAAADQLLNI
jgi:DNA repair protein RecN (Recombination protein N)